jgi:hypothetical protein
MAYTIAYSHMVEIASGNFTVALPVESRQESKPATSGIN